MICRGGCGIPAAAFFDCKIILLLFSEILQEMNSAFYGVSFIIMVFQNPIVTIRR